MVERAQRRLVHRRYAEPVFKHQRAEANAVSEPTFYVEREITKQWKAFAEYAGDFPKRGGPKEIGHFGTAYRLTARQQVDFHFGLGVSRSAPSHFFAIGYSLRIDRIWGR
jgi:hypothetical protein